MKGILQSSSLRDKCAYSEFFQSVFSRIRTEYGEIRSIQSECGKIRTRKTPNTDTFYAVVVYRCGCFLFQSQQWKHQKTLKNLLNANNKGSRMTVIDVVLMFLFRTLFPINFTHYSGISTVKFQLFTDVSRFFVDRFFQKKLTSQGSLVPSLKK